MTQVIKSAWDKTKGYKTASAGVLLLIFQLLKLIWPDIVSEQWEEWIYNAIGTVGATGVLDKLWRTRDKFIEWLKQLWQRRKNLKRSADDSPGK